MSKSLSFVFAGLFIISSMSQAAPVPQYDGLKREGVASCASSTCHGSVFPRAASKVAQNEYVTWSRHDAHAQAYKTLLTEESKLIAEKLGLPNAHEAGICLDCHADNVAENQHGERFVLADGVGCEACHGGAENYLDSHTNPDTTHAENIANGLYPTDNPTDRAMLCLSCHLGNETKFATHTIMGAGHPRLSFELDTFTILQPLHFEIDEDYRANKVHSDNFHTWVLGQLQTAISTLENIETRLYLDDSLFPEVALFDCHSCHHSMEDIKWNKAKGGGMKPGDIRLNDAHLKIVTIITRVFSHELNSSLQATIKKLKSNIHNKAAVTQHTSELRRLLVQVSGDITQRQNIPMETKAHQILVQILDMGGAGQFYDYIAAEQAVMAIDILVTTLNQQSKLDNEIEQLYQSVQNEVLFDGDRLKRVLNNIAGKI
ncbi:MAG: multiheme c-type cytochrome [Aestuariibacter sp.]